jgi:asparagine synthase (glutamine-hydrolysing)
MSAILGYGRLDRNEADAQYASKMLDRMNHWDADASNLWFSNSLVLGHLLLQNSPQSAYEQQPYFDSKKGMCITADATLFNRKELMHELNIVYNKELPDSELILKAYQKWGKGCPSHFNGGFAFVIWDKNLEEFFCARDHHGIKPFYYSYESEQFSFASEVKGILELPYVNRKVDGLWVVDYLCRIWLDTKSTLYKNIKRLEPAQTLTVNKGGLHFYSYWKLDEIKELKLNSEEEYIEAFREKLENAIDSRLSTSYGVASELSGGLDSSCVTTIAHHKLKGEKFKSYSFVLPKRDLVLYPDLHDEREWIKIITEHTGIENIGLLSGEGVGVMEAFEWNNKVQDEPPKEMNCMYRDIMYREIQASNTRVLLSGFGGDEMVSQHANEYISGLIQTGEWKLSWDEVKQLSQEKNRSLFRTLGGLVIKNLLNTNSRQLQRLIRNITGKVAPVREKLKHRPIQQALFEKYKVEGRFEAYQDRYRNTGSFLKDQVRRMQQPHVMYRLEACDIATRSFKMEYRYPLLDISLIEFYLSLPAHMKAKRGRGRYIFRKTIEEYLPDSIVWRASKKGSSNPQSIVRSKIDGSKIKEQLETLPKDHAIHQFADFTKLKENTLDGEWKSKKWRHETTNFMNLLLAKKIEKVKKQ